MGRKWFGSISPKTVFQRCFSVDPKTLCAQSLSHVQLFETPWTVAHQVPMLHGILEWVAIYCSSGSSWSRDWTHISNNSWASSCLFLLSISYFLPLPFIKALNGKEVWERDWINQLGENIPSLLCRMSGIKAFGGQGKRIFNENI